MGVLSRWRRRSTSALDRAEQLGADGRWLEAMTLLGAENRAHPNGAIEAEIVQLRHRAFAELDRNGGDSTSPHVADPFPDVEGVPPEVTRDRLDADTLRGAVEHHGSLLIRGLIPPERVADLRDDIDRAFDAHDARAGEVDSEPPRSPEDESARWYTPLAGDGIDSGILDFDRAVAIAQGGMLAADSPRALFDILDLYRQIGVLSVLTEYFGEHPTLSARKTTLRKVHADKFFAALDGRGADSGWHQDGAFLGEGVRSMNLWVALSHCGQDAPSLDLVARRVGRILPTGTEGAAFDWAASTAVVTEAGGGSIVRPDFAPGDALFFDGFLVHQTGATPTMTQTRYAIESWFFAPSTYPLEWIPLVS